MKKIPFIILFIILIIWLIVWFAGRKKEPMEFGVSFNQIHAESLGLDWKQTYVNMLDELRPPFVRIAAMWSQVEPKKGVWDFSDVDFMMKEAEKYNAKVVLVVGQKAPRWPECHVPTWIEGYSKTESKKDLLVYVEKVVGRYKDSPALDMWQVENEAFINFTFGECASFDQEAVVDEINLVRQLDSNHSIMMTDSGELSTWKKPVEYGDVLGSTLYRIVRMPNGMRFSYFWLPAGFYKLKADYVGKDKDHFMISELQAEPWFSSSDPLTTPIDIQEQTMTPKRMIQHIEYARHTGASRAYLWGVEWWAYMKDGRGDDRYWNIAKDLFQSPNNTL